MDAASENAFGPEPAPEQPAAKPAPIPQLAAALDACLAGLQAGMSGTFWMLGWLGFSSVWDGRGFWRAENLMASAFYRAEPLRSGLGSHALSGLALYLVLYSLLGAAAALFLRDRLPPVRTALACVALAVSWYFVSFGWLWTGIAPLVARLHPGQPTLLGHLIYGAFLGRFPMYLAENREN